MATPPKGAKVPTDRQPKTTEQDDARTVTAAGQDWTVPTDALNDFELLDDLGELEDGNAARLPRIMKRLLGDDYKKALDALRDEDTKRVPIEAAGEFITEILQGLDPNS